MEFVNLKEKMRQEYLNNSKAPKSIFSIVAAEIVGYDSINLWTMFSRELNHYATYCFAFPVWCVCVCLCVSLCCCEVCAIVLASQLAVGYGNNFLENTFMVVTMSSYPLDGGSYGTKSIFMASSVPVLCSLRFCRLGRASVLSILDSLLHFSH